MVITKWSSYISIEQAKSESVNLILDVIFVDTNKDTSNSTYPFDKRFDGILNFLEFLKMEYQQMCQQFC